MTKSQLELKLDNLNQEIMNLKTYKVRRNGRLAECLIPIKHRHNEESRKLINNAVVKLSDIKNILYR